MQQLLMKAQQDEAELGMQLFERLPRGLALTEAGAAYSAALAPAWERMQAATDALRGDRRLTVSVMPSFAANWLVPRLAGGEVPGLVVETSADCVDLGSRTDLDCAVRLGIGPWPGVESEVVLPVDAVPVAAPGVVWGVERLADLLGRPLIGSTHQTAFWPEWFAAQGMDRSTVRGPGFDNLQVIYEAAAGGMGIALGLEPVVRPYLANGRLVRVFPEAIRLPRSFHLVRRPGRADRRIDGFRDWLRDQASVARVASR